MNEQFRSLTATPEQAISGRRRTRSRPGFAVIELLVVVAVIVTIISLLIPSMLHGRQAARRSQCKNNLRQLSLAIHNYVGNCNVLPPGYVHRADPATGENMAGFGWATMLLPYNDQQALYDIFDFDAAIWQPENVQATSGSMGMYVCPEDIVSDRKAVGVGTSHFGMGSYVANFGPGKMDINPDDRRGVFSRNSRTKLQQIPDGLSNTMLVCERQNGPLREPGQPSSESESKVIFETTWAGAVRGFDDPTDDQAHLVLFQSGHVPGSIDSDKRDASTSHAGGFHAVFGDGGVRFLNTKIDLKLYQELSTRNSGNMLPNF